MMNMIFKSTDAIRFSSAGKFVEGDGSIHPHRKLESATLLIGCSGCYPIAQDGREYPLCDGTYLLLFPHREHYGTFPASGGQSHYWCHFLVPDADIVISEKSDVNFICLPEFGKLNNPERFKLLFHQLIDSSEREYKNPVSREQICGMYVKLLIAELYENALENSDSEEESTKKKQRLTAAKVREYLRIHARENISVAGLSAIFHYNPDYLTSIFRLEYGITIRAYMNLVRINEAKKILVETDLKINDVALAVGFGGEKYFMKTFKKLVGVTPSQFKQLHYRTHMNIK